MGPSWHSYTRLQPRVDRHWVRLLGTDFCGRHATLPLRVHQSSYIRVLLLHILTPTHVIVFVIVTLASLHHSGRILDMDLIAGITDFIVAALLDCMVIR